MAYNYFPVNYSPFTYYQPQQQQTQQNGMLWVGNEQEAMVYPVAPNCAVALWDSMQPYVYIKQADASGKPVFKAYELRERLQNAPTSAQGGGGSNYTTYATKSEIEALRSEIDELKAKLKEKTNE